MAGRAPHVRQALVAGVAMSLFLTVWNTLQSPSRGRWASFVLTVGACAVTVSSVLVAARTVQAR